MLVVNQLLQGPRHLINICLFVSGEFLPAYDTFIPEHTQTTLTQLRCLCLCFWAAHTVPQLAPWLRGMAVIRF